MLKCSEFRHSLLWFEIPCSIFIIAQSKRIPVFYSGFWLLASGFSNPHEQTISGVTCGSVARGDFKGQSPLARFLHKFSIFSYDLRDASPLQNSPRNGKTFLSLTAIDGGLPFF
jgi:hypothetical protein